MNKTNHKYDPKFVFPQSLQLDLFNYLKDEQKEFVKPILRVLKKRAQEELCCSLLDYMETGKVIPPTDFITGALFFYITRAGLGLKDEPDNKYIIRPLHIGKSKMRQRIGSIIRELIPTRSKKTIKF